MVHLWIQLHSCSTFSIVSASLLFIMHTDMTISSSQNFNDIKSFLLTLNNYDKFFANDLMTCSIIWSAYREVIELRICTQWCFSIFDKRNCWLDFTYTARAIYISYTGHGIYLVYCNKIYRYTCISNWKLKNIGSDI